MAALLHVTTTYSGCALHKPECSRVVSVAHVHIALVSTLPVSLPHVKSTHQEWPNYLEEWNNSITLHHTCHIIFKTIRYQWSRKHSRQGPSQDSSLGLYNTILRPSRYSPCPGWLAWVTLYAAGHGGYIPDLCPAQNNISSPVLHQTVARHHNNHP